MSEGILGQNGKLYFRGYSAKGIIMKFLYLLIIFLSYSCEHDIENLIEQSKDKETVEREEPIAGPCIFGRATYIELSELEYLRVKEEYELYTDKNSFYIQADNDGEKYRIHSIYFSDSNSTLRLQLPYAANSILTEKVIEYILVDDIGEILLPELESIDDSSSEYSYYFREVL